MKSAVHPLSPVLLITSMKSSTGVSVGSTSTAPAPRAWLHTAWSSLGEKTSARALGLETLTSRIRTIPSPSGSSGSMTATSIPSRCMSRVSAIEPACQATSKSASWESRLASDSLNALCARLTKCAFCPCPLLRYSQPSRDTRRSWRTFVSPHPDLERYTSACFLLCFCS